jgi:hypothetical protein
VSPQVAEIAPIPDNAVLQSIAIPEANPDAMTEEEIQADLHYFKTLSQKKGGVS